MTKKSNEKISKNYSLYGQNTKIKSKTLGDIELKYISHDDLKFFASQLEYAENDEKFVAQIIHHQLVIPELPFTEFGKISDDELRKIAKDFISKEKHTFRYFEETTDEEFFSNFKKAIEKYHQEYHEKLKTYFESIRDSLQSGSLKLTLELAQKWLQEKKWIFDAYKKLWKRLEEEDIAAKEAIEILRKYKWFIPASASTDFVFEVVKIGGRRGNQRKAMNKLFVDYFSSDNFKNLRSLVDNWEDNTIFKPRMKIFRDCVCALRDAKGRSNPSNLVIPTLIAQIDGIIKDFMTRHGFSWNKFKVYDSNGNKVDWRDAFKNQTSDQDFSGFNYILLNILFQRAYTGEPLAVPFTFSRHKIIHGEYIKYGRMENTIRAFLILDFLAELK